MKDILKITTGILLAGMMFFTAKIFVWGWFLTSLNNELGIKTRSSDNSSSFPSYRTVTEIVKPKSLRDCQSIYGAEINATIQTCMEGSILTVRVNSKTGDREILQQKKYYHLEKQNVL